MSGQARTAETPNWETTELSGHSRYNRMYVLHDELELVVYEEILGRGLQIKAYEKETRQVRIPWIEVEQRAHFRNGQKTFEEWYAHKHFPNGTFRCLEPTQDQRVNLIAMRTAALTALPSPEARRHLGEDLAALEQRSLY